MLILAKGLGWLAVHKPADITVHNNNGEDLVSLVKAQQGNADPVFLVNRLDFGTSGIVLIATNNATAAHLQQQFEKRTVKKTYLAIGSSPTKAKAMTHFEGTWKWYLTKRAEGRSNPQGFLKMRVPCKTIWQGRLIDEQTMYFTLEPLTGRKHQIRRHAALAGWPLLGDDRYGPKADDAAAREYGRLALHAAKLEFDDPDTGQRIIVDDSIDWQKEGFAEVGPLVNPSPSFNPSPN